MGAGASTGGVPSASRLSGCKDSKFLWEHLAQMNRSWKMWGSNACVFDFDVAILES